MITLRRNIERRHDHRGMQALWSTFYPQDHTSPLAGGFELLDALDEVVLPPGEGTPSPIGDEAEIVTYVHKGALAQEDSTGYSGVIHAGEFQYMSAGCGIRCKETNAAQVDSAHLFRISLHPSEPRLDSTREQKRFTAAQRRNMLCVIASPDGRKGSLRIRQDAFVYSSIVSPGVHLVHELSSGRSAWLHIIFGAATLHEIVLTQGDGVGISLEPSVSLTCQEHTEVLLVDLASTTSSKRRRLGVTQDE